MARKEDRRNGHWDAELVEFPREMVAADIRSKDMNQIKALRVEVLPRIEHRHLNAMFFQCGLRLEYLGTRPAFKDHDRWICSKADFHFLLFDNMSSKRISGTHGLNFRIRA